MLSLLQRAFLRARVGTIRTPRARAPRSPRRRGVGPAGLVLVAALVLGLAAPNEWTPQALATDAEAVETESSPSESSTSDPIEEAFAAQARPRLRHRPRQGRRSRQGLRRTALRRALDGAPLASRWGVDEEPPAHAVSPLRRRIETGRERLTRHQTFLI